MSQREDACAEKARALKQAEGARDVLQRLKKEDAATAVSSQQAELQLQVYWCKLPAALPLSTCVPA